MFPVCFNIYFFIAGRNSSGSVNNAPGTPTFLSMYFFEKLYNGKDLMVSHTTLYPFDSICLTSSVYP